MDNRQLIFDVALQLFADRGYDAVGVQEIAETAGLTKPTLYHYYGSKLGLLEFILRENFSEFNPLVAAACEYQHDLPGTLLRLAQVYFDYAQQHSQFYRLHLALWFSPPQSEAALAAMPWNKERHSAIERLFIRATKDHGNMAGRQHAYATTLVGTLNTYIGMALNGYVQLNPELARLAVRQFQYGIYS